MPYFNFSIVPAVPLNRGILIQCFTSKDDMSRVMRKPAFCIYQNKDADQLRSNCAADQLLCFCYIDSTIPLLPISEISSLWPFSVAVQPGLCLTWLENPKTGFLTTRLISHTSSRNLQGSNKKMPAHCLAYTRALPTKDKIT